MNCPLPTSAAITLSLLLTSSGAFAQDASDSGPGPHGQAAVIAPEPLAPEEQKADPTARESIVAPAPEEQTPPAEEAGPVAEPGETPTAAPLTTTAAQTPVSHDADAEAPVPPNPNPNPEASANDVPATSEAPPPKAAEASWQSTVIPYVSVGAGAVFAGLGLALLGAGAYPAVLQFQAQSELKALEEAGGGAANLEQARQLQTQSYEHEKNFQQFGGPVMAAGLALTLGGVAIAAGGGYLVAQSFMEE